MKREIEQIWFTVKLPHLSQTFAGTDYLGPEIRTAGRQWSGHIDFDTREVVLRLLTGEGWRTYRLPYDSMVKTYRGAPTKAKAGKDEDAE